MTQRTRYSALGLQGRQATSENSLDTFIKVYEFPIDAVASGAEQDTGVAAPAGWFQVISAVIQVDTAEATGTTKTVDVGTTSGSGADILNDASVAATGPVGTPVTAAVAGGGNFSFTLGSADFAELDATCVVYVLAKD